MKSISLKSGLSLSSLGSFDMLQCITLAQFKEFISKQLGDQNDSVFTSAADLNVPFEDCSIISGDVLMFTKEEYTMRTVDHVVVLMLENRSFDSILGWLYNFKADECRIHVAGSSDGNPKFFGLDFPMSDDMLEEKCETNESRFYDVEGHRACKPSEGEMKSDNDFRVYASWPPANPHEDHAHIRSQLYGVNQEWNWNDTPSMKGFVDDYESVVGQSCAPSIMCSVHPRFTPVLHTLAQEYAVCDRWFSSVPSQTWTNRLFAFSGGSKGIVNNEPYSEKTAHLSRWPPRTIMSHMEEFHGGAARFGNVDTLAKNSCGVDPEWTWKVYTHWKKADMMHMLFSGVLDNKNRPSSVYETIDQFEKDAGIGALPNFSVIEPQYTPIPGQAAPHNDQHPAEPVDSVPFKTLADALKNTAGRTRVWEAERLILRIYTALFSSTAPARKRTVLLITYDEHGGCYDHVPPPPATPPHGEYDPNRNAGKEFCFQRLGVRVPAVLVSPHIKRNTVLRPKLGQRDFDHTSLMSSMRSRWLVGSNPTPPLTRRDAEAPTFWHALGGGESARDPDELIKAMQQSLDSLDEELSRRCGVRQHDTLDLHGAQRPRWALTGLGRSLVHYISRQSVALGSWLGVLKPSTAGKGGTLAFTLPAMDAGQDVWDAYLDGWLSMVTMERTPEVDDKALELWLTVTNVEAVLLEAVDDLRSKWICRVSPSYASKKYSFEIRKLGISVGEGLDRVFPAVMPPHLTLKWNSLAQQAVYVMDEKLAVDSNRVVLEKASGGIKSFVGGGQIEGRQVKGTGGRRIALTVTNEDYSGGFSRLKGCHVDGKNIVRLLTDVFEFDYVAVIQNATYDLFVTALQSLLEQALNKDDIIVFHYSGHGSTRWLDDDRKIPSETFVSVDSHHQGGPNRDFDDRMLNAWITHMNEKTKNVVLFLDSCCSGGMPKGLSVTKTVFGDERPAKDQGRPERPTFSFDLAQGEGIAKAQCPWILPNLQHDYVLLAAAEKDKSGYLCLNNPEENGSVFTRALVEVSQSLTGTPSYKNVMDRVIPIVQSYRPDQRPTYDGQFHGKFLGLSQRATCPFLEVRNCEWKDEHTMLTFDSKITPFLLKKGLALSIYPPGTDDFSKATALSERKFVISDALMGTLVTAKGPVGCKIEKGSRAMLEGMSAEYLERLPFCAANYREIECVFDEKFAEWLHLQKTPTRYQVWFAHGAWQVYDAVKLELITPARNGVLDVLTDLVSVARFEALRKLSNPTITGLVPTVQLLAMNANGHFECLQPVDGFYHVAEKQELQYKIELPPSSKGVFATMLNFDECFGISKNSGEGSCVDLFEEPLRGTSVVPGAGEEYRARAKNLDSFPRWKDKGYFEEEIRIYFTTFKDTGLNEFCQEPLVLGREKGGPGRSNRGPRLQHEEFQTGDWMYVTFPLRVYMEKSESLRSVSCIANALLATASSLKPSDTRTDTTRSSVQ